jgi:hypothetical protein
MVYFAARRMLPWLRHHAYPPPESGSVDLRFLICLTLILLIPMGSLLVAPIFGRRQGLFPIHYCPHLDELV